MAKQLKVKAACVVVNVGGQERYLYRGAVLPSGVEQKDVNRLRSNGLIVEFEAKAAQGESEKVEIPDGEPAESWKVPQLKAYAAEHDIDLGDATKKDDILAKLGVAAPAPGADTAGAQD